MIRTVMPLIFTMTDRRRAEAEVLKPILKEPSGFRLEQLAQEHIETKEFKIAYGDLLVAARTGKPFDYLNTRNEEAVLEVLQADDVNGDWSILLERLSCHRFDRLDFPRTDLGNAERFQQEHGAEVRYDHKRGKWLLWDGVCWKEDAVGEIFELMAHTLRQIYSDAESLPTITEREAAAKWAIRCESRSSIENALVLARNRPHIRAVSTDFDRDNSLTNCPNGVLDLRSNSFRAHDHRDLMIKSLGVPYDEYARCQWFEEDFLPTIFDNDRDLIGFIQQSAGLALSGLTDAQYLWLLHGGGSNGKSTFVQILSMVLGTYHTSAPTSMLLVKRGDGANNDIARLHGARLVTCQEVDLGRKLAEAQVKSLTGQDRITARFLYGEYFEFEPTFKLWLIANHRPVISGTDDAIWRRILLIPFTKQIPPLKRKPLGELMAIARREGPGILNWLVEGWLRYKAVGLCIPDKIRVASETYRDESDYVGQFLSECCVLAGEIAFGELYEAYDRWAGGSAMTSRMFQDAMKERDFKVRVGAYKQRFWEGVGLISRTPRTGGT